MKTFKILVFGLLSLATISGFGQNPFVRDTSKTNIVFPYGIKYSKTDTIDYGGKLITSKQDYLGRDTLEIQWHEGLREEIRTQYKGKSDTIISKIDIVYNDSTKEKVSSEEFHYKYNSDGTLNRKKINNTYSNGKLTSSLKYIGKYFSDKRPIFLTQFKDFDGDSSIDEGKKQCFEYKENGKIVKFYRLNKKGKFILYSTSPLLN